MHHEDNARMSYKHFRMDIATHAKLARLAKAERRTMAAVVRQMLSTYEAAELAR